MIALRSSLLLALLLCALTPAARGDLNMDTIPSKKRKPAEIVNPPLAMPVTVEIAPGDTVQIPLRIYGWRGRNVRYLLRSKPKYGTLGELTPGEEAVWQIHYQHQPTMATVTSGTLVDRFTFAAQDSDGTSSPAEVLIKIVEPPPDLVAPEAVDFGTVLIQTPVTRTFRITNRGGHTVQGPILLNAPWSIEPKQYRLGRGESAEFRLTFLSPDGRDYRGILTLPHLPDKATILSARAIAPLQFIPATVQLTSVITGSSTAIVRSGTLHLLNQTDQPQTVAITSRPPLKHAESLVIEAGETANLPIELGEEHLPKLTSTLSFRIGAITQTVPVNAPALPGKLWIAPSAIDFGSVEADQPHQKVVHLENRGGSPASVIADPSAPFQATPSRFEIAPGQKIEVKLDFTPTVAGAMRGEVAFQTAHSRVAAALQATVLAPIPKAPIPRIPSAFFDAPQRVLSEHPGEEESDALNAQLHAFMQRGRTGIPSVAALRVERLRGNAVAIHWSPPDPATVQDPNGHPIPWSAEKIATLDYRVEGRTFTKNEKGVWETKWIPLPEVTLERTSNQITAPLGKIPPGATLTVQVVALHEGKPSDPSPAISISIPPDMPFFTTRRVLGAAFAALFVFAVTIRFLQRNR